MTRITLAAAALLAACAARAADAPRHPQCPDGKDPVLTGQPFRPLRCPQAGEKPGKSVEPDEAALPKKGSWSAALKGLDGSWRGLAYFAGNRYEVTLDVSGSGRQWRLKAMDYATHVFHPLEAELKKPGWFSGGMPKLEVSSPSLPGSALSARLWLGANPPKPAGATAHEHVAVWKYSGRPELHRVEYTAKGDAISAVYSMTLPDVGPVGATLDLTRVRAD